MVSYFLGVSVVLLVYLSLYALVFFGLGFFGLLKRYRPTETKPSSEQPEICVLIPSYNEGEGVIDAATAVIGQDYQGFIELRIIVNSWRDNSIQPLLKYYGLPEDVARDCQIGAEGLVVWSQDKRSLKLVMSGLQNKKDKINQALENLNYPYVALIDADHRPSPNWLSSSISLCPQTVADLAGVQTRRQSLDASHLAQIWDSSQNHLGNELVNNILSGRSVFFTGTAAVFKTNILQRFLLQDSITEDTYLSYDLWCAGYKIAYNSQASSYEEVSPSFLAYILRRRRWAAGHNQSFFKHLVAIFRAKLPIFSKVVLLIHGQFYLVPLAVWLLISVYGIYFFRQLAGNFQLVVIVVSVSLSLILAYVFRAPARSSWRFLSDWLVSFLWLAPQLSISVVYLYKLIGAEQYYYILIFPYANDWLLWHLFLISAPLFSILGAWSYFKDSRRWLNLWIIPTYFFTLFLDIYAALLGFLDYLLGRAYWSKIERRNSYSVSMVPENVSDNLVTGQIAKGPNKAMYFIGAILILTVILVNDLLATNNCGRVEPFLWSPLFLKSDTSLDLKINFKQNIVEPGFSRVLATVAVINESGAVSPDNLYLTTYLDGQLLTEREINTGLTTVLDKNYPLGWEKHNLSIKLVGEGIGRFSTCHRQADFSTSIKELRGQSLYINDEKFLIKGLIPSFSNSQIGLEIERGLAQIKETGANAVRFYHSANERLLNQAAKAGLLVIDQPDRSTWGEFDLSSDRQVRSYLGRYQELITDHRGEPYVLWSGLGNEWELGSKNQPGQTATQINELIKESLSLAPSAFSSYSTYYTFIKYPVSVLGVNMLDTGHTYWNKALNILYRSGQPFYASEFGGFVAFWETTNTELRLRRMIDEWKVLLEAGSIGANFYQSHDNWAQPVVTGYNDPWQPEQPDDLRGFWDEKNQAKPELEVLSKLLSDLEVSWADSVSSGDRQIKLVVKNIRPYRLSDIKVQIGLNNNSDFSSIATLDIGDLGIAEEKNIQIELPAEAIASDFIITRFSYFTHSGLPGVSRVKLVLPVQDRAPLILNSDFISESKQNNILTGRLVYSDNLKIILPTDWKYFSINNKKYTNSGELMDIPVNNPYQAVDDLEISRDGQSWTGFIGPQQAGGGNYYIRFRWPEISAQEQALILSGIGDSEVKIDSQGKIYTFPTHNYRENYISAEDLDWPQPGDMISLQINRQQATYISFSAIKNGMAGVETSLLRDVLIDLSPPVIFAPRSLLVKQETN